jgi:hypothetical protein
MSSRELETVICREAGRVLQLPGPVPDANRPLISYGVDSLAACELKDRLEALFNTGVPLGALLRGASAAELAVELAAASDLARMLAAPVGRPPDPDGGEPCQTIRL